MKKVLASELRLLSAADPSEPSSPPSATPSTPPRPFPRGPYEYTGPIWGLAKAKKFLESKGFVEQGKRDSGMDAELFVYQHPSTGQRANLSHYYRDRKGPKDETQIVFHTVSPAKRRTPEQKRRDNFVLYD